MKRFVSVFLLVVAGACASVPPPADLNHPASAGAAESPAPAATVLARATNGPLFPTDAGAPMPMHHHGHDMTHAPPTPMTTTMPTTPTTTTPTTTTTTPTTPTTAADPAAAEVYACPMHPEVTSSKPGKCPKCGMQLKKQAKR